MNFALFSMLPCFAATWVFDQLVWALLFSVKANLPFWFFLRKIFSFFVFCHYLGFQLLLLRGFSRIWLTKSRWRASEAKFGVLVSWVSFQVTVKYVLFQVNSLMELSFSWFCLTIFGGSVSVCLKNSDFSVYCFMHLWNGVFEFVASSGSFMGFLHSKLLWVTSLPDPSFIADKEAFGVPFLIANLGKLLWRPLQLA